MASVEPVVALTLRLPESLKRRLYAVRGERSLNSEIVERLRRSLNEEQRARAEMGDRGSFVREPPSLPVPPVPAARVEPTDSPFLPPALQSKPDKVEVAKKVAASVEGVGFAQDLVKTARPFGKQDQAGGKR